LRAGGLERRPANRELMGRQLAKQDGTGGAQLGGDAGVGARDVVDEDLGMTSGRQPDRIDDVLETVGNAVERAAVAASGDLALGRARGLECPFRGEPDKGMQLRLDTLDPCEQSGRVLDGRQLPGADELRRLGYGQERELTQERRSFAW
jgi:hypothetical protein